MRPSPRDIAFVCHTVANAYRASQGAKIEPFFEMPPEKRLAREERVRNEIDYLDMKNANPETEMPNPRKPVDASANEIEKTAYKLYYATLETLATL